LSRGGWIWDDTRYVDIEQFDRRSKGGGAKAGDIILSREGTVGIAAMVQPGMELCLGQRLVQVRVTSSDCDPQFLLAHLLEVLQPEKISQQLVGSTAKHLNVADLKKLKTPIVGESQRAKFASQVVQIENLEQKVAKAIMISSELYAARAYEAFG
jgi:type I restriction enzyme S subunit